jgi:hypothetical protein
VPRKPARDQARRALLADLREFGVREYHEGPRGEVRVVLADRPAAPPAAPAPAPHPITRKPEPTEEEAKPPRDLLEYQLGGHLPKPEDAVS